jgi:hypothetical protein
MANGKQVMVRMDGTLLAVVDKEAERLAALCGLGPLSRSAVLRIALVEFACNRTGPPWMTREGPARKDSVERWTDEWIDELLRRAKERK